MSSEAVETLTFAGAKKLLERLAGGRRKLLFLVGSALTMPSSRAPGVANVGDVVGLIREEIAAGVRRLQVKAALRDFDQALKEHDKNPGKKYQRAFEELKARVGPEAVNRVIRRAVLQACVVDPSAVDLDDPQALARLEREGSWHLGPGVKALGSLLAGHPERLARTVLTTNFDPLIEVAVRAAEGEAHAVEQLADGAIGVEDPSSVRVIHVHGLWRGDTLHTPGALTIPRDRLVRSLARVFDDVTLVVLAYGGWDDVLTEAITELGRDASGGPDVLWCFYESDRSVIAQRYPKVLERLRSIRERSVCYSGIDCNVILPQLRELLDREEPIIGRGELCEQLEQAMERKAAVEILGEARMGRTRLLLWVKEQAIDVPVAYVDAATLGDATAVTFVRHVAEQLGRSEVIKTELRRVRAVPNVDDATRAISLLEGSWILVDNADALARDKHDFHGGFFDTMRGALQDLDLRWVSTSRVPLAPLFAGHGVTSPFLNDSALVYAGGLERRSVTVELRARVGDRAPRAEALAGTLPALFDRVCESEWGDVEGTLSGLAGWAESLFALWWERSSAEQSLLARAVGGVGVAELDEEEKAVAAELCLRGLMVEVGGVYRLNGEAWEGYVRGRS